MEETNNRVRGDQHLQELPAAETPFISYAPEKAVNFTEDETPQDEGKVRQLVNEYSTGKHDIENGISYAPNQPVNHLDIEEQTRMREYLDQQQASSVPVLKP